MLYQLSAPLSPCYINVEHYVVYVVVYSSHTSLCLVIINCRCIHLYTVTNIFWKISGRNNIGSNTWWNFQTVWSSFYLKKNIVCFKMLNRISYSVEHHQSSDHCGECYLNALFQAYFLGNSHPIITKNTIQLFCTLFITVSTSI